MKTYLLILFTLISISAFAQPGSQKISGLFLRVLDSAAYQSAAASSHAASPAGYADIYWNAQATTPHYDIWNGSSYDHVFDFGGGGGGTVTSVSGTSNRITSTGGTTPVIDISATFEALLGKVAQRIDQNNASTTSTQFVSVISDEVGTGSVVLSEPDVNTQTGNYTLVLSDKAKEVRMNVASSNTLTVPPNSSVAFPVGTVITVSQYGIGPTSLVEGSGVTIRTSAGQLTIPKQYAVAALRKIGTDEWYLWNGTGGQFESGTFTPTLTNTTNVAASTAYLCTYVRVDNTVTISGRVDIDPTSASSNTVLGMTIPIPSAFTTANQAGGVAFSSVSVSDGAAILSDATNDRLTIQYICTTDVTNHAYYFTVTYQRIP